MLNPVTFSLKMQQAALEAATAATRAMAANYVRLVGQQSRLLCRTCVHNRDDDHDVVSARKGKSGRKSPCLGPDLLDHYGKRAHDIDAEHI